MEAINYTTFRSKLTSILDMVNDDRNPVMVTRQKGQLLPFSLLMIFDHSKKLLPFSEAPKMPE